MLLQFHDKFHQDGASNKAKKGGDIFFFFNHIKIIKKIYSFTIDIRSCERPKF